MYDINAHDSRAKAWQESELKPIYPTYGLTQADQKTKGGFANEKSTLKLLYADILYASEK